MSGSIRSSRMAFGLVAGGVLLAASAWAAQKAVNLDHLCRGAEHIVIGTVTDVQGYRGEWTGVGKVIFSDITIDVTTEWKGQLSSKTLVLQVPGGYAPDGERMQVSGAPVFAKGEKVLVFTETRNDRHWVRGWEQGKFRVVVERVVGFRGHPIPEDILTHALKRKVEAILASPAPKTDSEKKEGGR